MVLLAAVFMLLTGALSDTVFYRSRTVPHEQLARQPEQYEIKDDKGENIAVTLLLDRDSRKIYWYRRLFTEVCLTGECRPIDIGIYWTGEGKYLGVEVFRENLTKTDHSEFSDFDYRKLETALRDEWSALREFAFDELVDEKSEKEEKSEKKEGVDATTGATKKVIADASVKDAVYTTYTMWHLINVGEGEQLALLTYQYLNGHPDILSASLQQDNPAYLEFLIRGMSAGHLEVTERSVPVILSGLSHRDAALRNTALKAVGILPLNLEEVQSAIVPVYRQWEIPDKNRFLQSAGGMEVLRQPLYEALSEDLQQDNAWFLVSLLPMLARGETQSPAVLKRVEELEKKSSPPLKEAARKFLDQLSLVK